MRRPLRLLVAFALLLTACGGESVVSVHSQPDDLPDPSSSASDDAEYALAGSFNYAASNAGEATLKKGPVKSRLSDRCLDARGGVGSQLTVRDCETGNHQLFELTSWGQLRVNGACVGWQEWRAGASIVLERCKPSFADANGSSARWWQFDAKSRLTTMTHGCMDIAGGDRSSGARLVLWSCHDGDNQGWIWTTSQVAQNDQNRPLGPDYIIATMPDGDVNSIVPRCLDTQTRSPGSNAKLVAYDCHGGDSQQFRFDPGNGQTNGTIKIFGQYCLDGRLGHGQPVIFDHCNGSATQQWYTANIPGLDVGSNLANNSIRSGQIQNHGTGHCIDIANESHANNASVANWTCHQASSDRPRLWNQMFGVGHIESTGHAIVIERREPPAPRLGHTGWAIQLRDGRWLGGAWDGVTPWGMTPKGSYNGHWKRVYASKQEVLEAFAAGGENGQPYDWYKEVTVRSVNTAAVFSLEAQSWDWGYGVFGNNCLDQSVEVLNAYGWRGLPERGYWSGASYLPRVPNKWFDLVDAQMQDLPGRRTSFP